MDFSEQPSAVELSVSPQSKSTAKARASALEVAYPITVSWDSNAKKSLISLEKAIEFGIWPSGIALVERRNLKPIGVVMIDQKPCHVWGKSKPLELEFTGSWTFKASYVFNVVSASQDELILGKDFLDCFGICLRIPQGKFVVTKPMGKTAERRHSCCDAILNLEAKVDRLLEYCESEAARRGNIEPMLNAVDQFQQQQLATKSVAIQCNEGELAAGVWTPMMSDTSHPAERS